MAHEGLRMRDEVAVDQPGNRLDAELRRGALESSGIDARLATDDAGGMHPHLGPAAGGLVLFVPADQADDARELLAGLDAGTWSLGDTDPTG